MHFIKHSNVPFNTRCIKWLKIAKHGCNAFILHTSVLWCLLTQTYEFMIYL